MTSTFTFMRGLSYISSIFFYARTHGKITWQWKSNFSLKMSVLTGCPYKAGYQKNTPFTVTCCIYI